MTDCMTGCMTDSMTDCMSDCMTRGGGGSPYIQMIGMIVVFLGVVIRDLVFSGDCSSKIL